MSNYSNKGFFLIGIIIALVIVGAVSGGLYYYLQKQISEIPEINEKPSKEEVVKPKEVVPLSTGEVIIPGEKEVIPGKGQSGVVGKATISRKNSVAIIIDTDTYNQVKTYIDRLKSDIANDLNVDVFVHAKQWNNINEIRNILKAGYQNQGLSGSILIGEIPTAYFENGDERTDPFGYSEYSDWYYQDLDGNFTDSDGDGFFELENYYLSNIKTAREVWSGRIKPPVGGAEGVQLLKDYLDRNHDYRTGQLSYEKKLLIPYWMSNMKYLNEQEYLSRAKGISESTGLYNSNQIEIISPYQKSSSIMKSEYLSKLNTSSYEFMFYDGHSGPTTQYFGDGVSLTVTSDEIKDIKPQILFSFLHGCYNGAFLEKNYLAGSILFYGKGLIALGNSYMGVETIDLSDLRVFDRFSSLKEGVTFGEMYINDPEFMRMQLFGDPTLRLRKKPVISPKVSLDQTQLDFGTVSPGDKKEINLRINNNGLAKLQLRYRFSKYSIDQIGGSDAYFGNLVNYYFPPIEVIGSKLLGDIEINPGGFENITFSFPVLGWKGKYYGFILFNTNDPTNPYLKIWITGEVTGGQKVGPAG
ncbi:MAG: C25 family cysteine peptidase [Patescibacteria group bacterium]